LTDPDVIIREEELDELLELLHENTKTKRVTNLLHRLKKFNKVTQSKYINKIADKTGWDHTLLKEEVQDTKEQDQNMSEALQGFDTYVAMAERFHELHPVYYDEQEKWWMWNEEHNIWEQTDETNILIHVDQYTKKNTTSGGKKNQILEGLRRVGRKNQPEPLPPHWIQFKNIIVDVKNKEEITPSPEYFTTNAIPWSVGENTATPNIDELFHEWVRDEDVQKLYEIIAYSLLPDYPINRLFCLHGRGNNGKGKFQDLITTFLGERNVGSSDLKRLERSRFEASNFYKKLACMIGETDFNTLTDTSTLKKITGGDLMSFEFKRKDPVQAYNYATIFMATNSLPPTRDRTDGFYRRWLIIDFPNQFEPGPDPLQRIPEQEYRNLARKCCTILPRLLQQGHFTGEGNIEAKRERYEELSNPLKLFFKQRIKEDSNGVIYKFRLRQEFKAFLEENGFRVWSNDMINKKLKDKARMNDWGETRTNRTTPLTTVDEDRYWAYTGISWVTGLEKEWGGVERQGSTPPYTLYVLYSSLMYPLTVDAEKPKVKKTLDRKAKSSDLERQGGERGVDVVWFSDSEIKQGINELLQYRDQIISVETIYLMVKASKHRVDSILDVMKRDGEIFEPMHGMVQSL
jgi:P4 family phage/plasmid primase-like protien